MYTCTGLLYMYCLLILLVHYHDSVGPCINGNWYAYKINVPVVTGIQMNMCSQLASYTILLTELLSF